MPLRSTPAYVPSARCRAARLRRTGGSVKRGRVLYAGRKCCLYESRGAPMAKTKKAKGKTKAKRAPVGKRTAARKKVRAGAPAPNRRVLELEAENRRLREEIAALRAEREERGGEIASEGRPALEL